MDQKKNIFEGKTFWFLSYRREYVFSNTLKGVDKASYCDHVSLFSTPFIPIYKSSLKFAHLLKINSFLLITPNLIHMIFIALITCTIINRDIIGKIRFVFVN